MDLSIEEKKRYIRQINLKNFGESSQLKLKESSILVVGAGGLGCPCLLYLNAAGVGRIGIADDDKVSLSNLHRQTLYNDADIGQLKADTARLKLLEKNPGTDIFAYTLRLTPHNAAGLVNQYDLVIDCSDNFYTRYLLNAACVSIGKPLIYGAIFEFEGQVSTFNYKIGPNLNDLFPVNAKDGEIENCSNSGVLGVLPGIIGTWQALEAIKVLTGIGEVLSGKLMVFDAFNNDIQILNFTKATDHEPEQQEELMSTPDSTEITWPLLKMWLENKTIQLIDVREDYEFEDFNIGGINLPLPVLNKKLHEINPLQPTVIICQTGIRSKKAIGIISEQYPEMKIYHLEKGLVNAGIDY